MSLGKLANGEVSAVLRENVSITTEGEAIARFDEIGSQLDAYRPGKVEEIDILPLTGEKDITTADYMISSFPIAGSVLALMVGFVHLFYNPWVSLWCGVAIGVSALFVTAHIGVRSNNGRAKNKFRNWLCKTFLTKKLNTKVRSHGMLLDEQEHSVKLYELLVKKAQAQLEAEGVFELVNHPKQTQFIALDSMGHRRHFSRRNWEERLKELESSKTIQDKISTAKELQKKISREILSSS